jgi:methylmalonyl-CoA epimerase
MHVLLTEDQELFRRAVREFAEREIAPVAAEHDEAETFPKENVRKMGQLGLMGLTVPTEYGGSGAGPVEYALAMEEVARADAAHSVILSVNSSLVCEPVLKHGTDEQRKDFLHRLSSGDMLGAFCLSEPQSGSDARHMQTKAVRDGDYYVLNGTKNWISNGGEAGLYIVFASLEGEEDRSAAFLVEYWRFGIRCGPKEKKLGIRASATTQVFLQDCRVPVGNRLGEEGEGFKIAMSALDAGRIGIAAQALGIAQAAFDAAVAYAKERQAFGHPISEFQGIQFMLADMQVRIEQSRLLVYQAALLEARGLPFAKESSMAKLSASETAMWVTTKAIQIHGGYGYSREYPVQRYFRDAKITEIYEGTSEIQRLVIARSILRGERPSKAPAEVAVEVPESKTPVLQLPPTPEELQRQMAPRKLHHVAVAVDSVDEALKFYRETLGLEEITVMTLEDRGLKVGLVKAGLSEIELLEPLQEDSTVGRFLDRRGPGLHHVCFEVEDVEKSMRYFEGRGATFLDPVPRPGAVGLVSFMPPSLADGVLVELAQTSGYTLPAPEAEKVEEEAPPGPVIHQPILRGPAGYTRHGLVSASTWGQTVPPAPVESTTEPEPPAPVIHTPIVRGAGGYTRHGLVSGGSVAEWPRREDATAPPEPPSNGPEPVASPIQAGEPASAADAGE